MEACLKQVACLIEVATMTGFTVNRFYFVDSIHPFPLPPHPLPILSMCKRGRITHKLFLRTFSQVQRSLFEPSMVLSVKMRYIYIEILSGPANLFEQFMVFEPTKFDPLKFNCILQMFFISVI